MIILRRLMLLPFVVVVLLLIFLSSVLVVINYQLMRPSFYGDALNKVGFYDQVMGPVLDQAIEDLYTVPYEELPLGFSGPIEDTINLAPNELASSIRRAIPPSWLQSSTDKLLITLESYMSESNSAIELNLETGGQIELIVKEIKHLLSVSDAYNIAYQRFLDPALIGISKQPLPLNIEISSSRLIEGSRVVIPPYWVQKQLEYALDEVTPYITGDVDEFTVHIDFTDRVMSASEELKLMLLEANTGQILYEGIIQPAIKGLISKQITFPYGLELNDEDIVEIMRTVAPSYWIEEQTSIAIDEVTKYIVGETDEMNLMIDISSNKLAAQNKIQESVNEYVINQLNLPICSKDQQSSLAEADTYLDFPLCIPKDSEIYSQTQSKMSEAINSLVFDAIPDTIDMDQEILRSQLFDLGGADSTNSLDNIRNLIAGGFTYTSTDLEEDIESSKLIKLDDFYDSRKFIRDGWSGDQKTLDSKLWGEANTAFISSVRSGINNVKTYGWIGYILIVITLIPIGLLGGNSLRERLLWGTGAFLICSLIVVILFGPIYSQYMANLSLNINTGAIDSNYFSGTDNLMAELGLTYWHQILSDVQRNLLIGPMIMFIVGLISIILIVFWDKVQPIVEGVNPTRLKEANETDNDLR